MLVVRHATASADGRAIIDDVSLDVERGHIAALLGPSGSGKSTLLRIIAGLQPRADITWNDRSMSGVPVHERPFGLMFQDHALFPHLSVGENVRFGLEMHHHPDPHDRVGQVLELVGMAGFEHRDPATLSGGEAQRVALARAIAPEPELLMLDEPLGSLDRTLRDRLLEDLAAVLRGVGMTAIYVTHDHDEARTVADTVAILDGGHVVQAGPTEEVWSAPATAAVADFLGYDVVVDIDVADRIWRTPWGDVTTDADTFAAAPAVQRAVIPPSAVRFDSAGSLCGTVEAHRYLGGRIELTVTSRGKRIRGPFASTPPPRGTEVRFDIDPDAVLLF